MRECYPRRSMKKRGVIFDLDGTLVSTVWLHEAAWSKLFGHYGITLTEADLREQSGKKNTLFVDLMKKKYGRDDLNLARLSAEKDAMVIEALQEHPPTIFPGVPELFAELQKDSEIRCALATSATEQTARLLGRDLLQFFDVTVFAEEVKSGKPNPEMFLTAAKKLGLLPEECVVFEDAESGVVAAKAGGFLCVAR